MDHSTDHPPGSKARVLLVGDQPSNLLALEEMLRDLGQDLVQAHSAEEALHHLLSDDCAVILLDVQVHGLDALALARRIRSRERSRQTPILFLAAPQAGPFPVIEAYRLGAVDYLEKPLMPAIVQAKVAGFVELFQKTEQLRRLERRELERRVEEGEEHFRLLVENVEDYAIVLLDETGNVTRWNVGAERLLGYGAEEVLGTHFSRFYLPEDIRSGRPEQELQRAATAGGAGDDNWLARKDGKPFWASGVTTALRDEEGRLRGFAKIVRDLTERKRLEEALRQRAEALTEAGQRKDEFLAILGHELRNPLAPIRNALHVLRLQDPQNPVLQQMREVIQRQVAHMVRLVDDLLDVSRITRGKVQLQKESVDLAAAVEHAVESTRSFMEERGHRLSVTLPPEPVRLEADPARLEQILANLLNNAAKYTEPGGSIAVAAAREGEQAVVRVRDTGIGIRPEVLPRIFDLFQQADRVPGASPDGLGIGLTLVRRLAELHGGSVEAYSAGPGQGSEFIVRLPALRAPAETNDGQSLPRPSAVGGRSFRVLVIDDNVDAAESLALVLRSAGHEVAVTHNGPSALATAPDFRPEVVFLDIGLPGGMDGYEVARHLRRQSGTRPILLVAVTGYGQEEDRQHAREAGFDRHVVKPADPGEIQRLLETWASQSLRQQTENT